MRASAEPQGICFGKLPIAGDFIRGDGPSPEFRELDEWIESGLYESQQRGSADWQTRFDALPPAKFIWSDERGPAIAGWLQTSRDAVGRRYPFLIAARLADVRDRDFAAIPLALADFFTTSRRMLDEAFAGHDVVGTIDSVQRLPIRCDLPATRAAMTAALDGVAVTNAWAGHDDAPELLLHDLAVSCEQSNAPLYSLRWPSRAVDSDIAFWLAAMATFGRPRPRLMMWHQSPRPGAHGRVRVLLGRLQARLFEGMLFSDQEDDDAYDLGRSSGADTRQQQAAARFHAVSRCQDQTDALALLGNGRRR